MIDPALSQLAQSLTGPFAFCGVGLQRGTAMARYGMACARGITADADTQFRTASLSKIITAQVLHAQLRRMGLDPSSPLDASDALGFDLRNPHHPDTPITVQMIASHTAGLHDTIVPTDRPLQATFDTTVPGQSYAYSNAGYVLLAAMAEHLSGKFFDALSADLLRSLGIKGSFNWAGGIPAKTLPTYRRDGAQYAAQIDAPPQVPPLGNVARWSPQGGLRTSLAGMTRLAASLRDTDTTRLWSPPKGDAYGWGVQFIDTPDFYPNPLIGHFGNAYGFVGGAWYDRTTDTAICYALNGRAMGSEDDAMIRAEREIFVAVLAILAKSPNLE